ncbi:hypothetical protein GHNINEIG_02337 [Hydrogenovibrio crunogenus]|uniref:Uncharacterized protein n=1 Tax=Hydrogenovibrio crunogenus TaxID=39765 RepID=A0A4P7P2L9_9GAMM|nr:hypothetical protein [Hydrogenovibrio crunogenus]QBZ84259.1 hypothetical protein GHNINEIG_02337 [Hydrogenovibrio crunogenus]RUM92520.1 MAG: hypothetical protein DSZ27_03165 [Thiomicrospira sp.]
MLITLITGMLLTALALGVLWGGFILLRRLPRFEHLNSRAANKRMLQLSLLFYFIGIILTIYWMA